MNNVSHTSRFLMQATLGADWELLNDVNEIGQREWLKAELSKPAISSSHFEDETRKIWLDFRKKLVARHGEKAINGDGNNPALPYKWYFRMAWWHHTLSSKEDLLRQRVALALSELLVISDNSSLELDAIGFASYYDLLYKHAFGNYAELLYDVSMHPTMGIYLSHMLNQKAVPEKHIHPDENYAREIMQLFSIGLFELDANGNEKVDVNDQPIPTYDNRDIKELARVFTGILPHSYRYEWPTSFWEEGYNGYSVSFDDDVEKQYKTAPFIEMTKPMTFDEKYHDRGAKALLKGHIKLPGNQSGEDEVWSVVQRLVSHPSAAPFVARHLINRLVTSNPSGDYVAAVASAFGKAGDLKAMIEVLLSYPIDMPVSGREIAGAYVEDGKLVQSQKLKSPMERSIQLLIALKPFNKSNKLWLLGDDLEESIQQHPMSAPNVFNFYKADYSPHGPIEKAGFVAPEFEIHTSATSIGYVNQMYNWILGEFLPLVSTKIGSTVDNKMMMEMDPYVLWEDNQDKVRLNLLDEIEIAKDPARHGKLIDRMGLLLTGRKKLSIKSEILKAIYTYQNNPLWVVQTIVFMISISPEFTVQEA